MNIRYHALQWHSRFIFCLSFLFFFLRFQRYRVVAINTIRRGVDTSSGVASRKRPSEPLWFWSVPSTNDLTDCTIRRERDRDSVPPCSGRYSRLPSTRHRVTNRFVYVSRSVRTTEGLRTSADRPSKIWVGVNNHRMCLIVCNHEGARS